MHETVRVDVPGGGFPFPVAVRQVGALAPAARGGQLQQHARRDLRLVRPGGVHKGGIHLTKSVRDPRWKDLAQFQQCRQRGLVAAENAAECCLAQPDGHGECLFVIEDQGRHPVSGPEAVTAPGPGVGLDSVAEFPEPGDVPAHRALGDRHLVGQLTAGPRGPCGQQ